MRFQRISPTARPGFTLVELLTVIAIIAILAALTLKVAGYAQNKAASSRAEAEIKAMEAACESYKADNGIYPRGPSTALSGPTISINATDTLNARTSGAPSATTYKEASLYLYEQLSGDTNANNKLDSGETKPYMEFKPTMLGGTKDSGGNITAVTYIQDPWGNSYGYSTAFQADPTKGYNPTFDLWSTASKTTTPTPGSTTDITPQWIKNW